MSEGLRRALIGAGIVVGSLAVIWALLRVNRLTFRRIQRKHTGLHLRFFERAVSLVILVGGVILALSLFGGFDSVWKTVLGGTAIVSAVLVFAAQDVLKDILAGLMISVYKPFEIGNRVELEDGTKGIIQDINMRHVVVQGLDTQRFIIPNSKLNAMRVRNFSYQAETRAFQADFRIAYGSNVERAMDVIREAVMDSPYSVPGKQTEQGAAYADVYFLAYEESSLLLSTTVYYNAGASTEQVTSDVNLRVSHALEDNGIEVPFPYINVVQK